MVQTGQKGMRTCVNCRASQGKGLLARVVRRPDGSVCFDGTGRAAGRGAYVCSERCLVEALANRKLQRALKCDMSQEVAEGILRDFQRCAADTTYDRR